MAVGRVGLPTAVVAPAGGGGVGADRARVGAAGRDGGVGVGGRGGGGLGVGAAVGDELGVDVEPAAVGVEEGFLVLDEAVSDVEVVLGGVLGGGAGGDGVGVVASAGDDVGVGAEQASIGVQQVLLVGDELVAYRDVLSGDSGLGRHRRPGRDNRAHSNSHGHNTIHPSFAHGRASYPPPPPNPPNPANPSPVCPDPVAWWPAGSIPWPGSRSPTWPRYRGPARPGGR